MILIISNSYDVSTDEVINWLVYFNTNFIRVNYDEPLKEYMIEINNCKSSFKLITKDKNTINSEQISSYWFRKSGISIGKIKQRPLIPKKRKFANFIQTENKTLSYFIESLISTKNGFGYDNGEQINKLKILQTAKECGLKIPYSVITNKKKYINPNSIIKAISEGIFYKRYRKQYITYTLEIQREKKLPDTFNSTLFQNNIQKRFELRIFYLMGDFYSMAIFSQNDEQTKTDFRKYNLKKPNRIVPYIIPSYLKKRILNLMKKLKFKTGSLDFLVDNMGEYIFLEINPGGQFGMVSKPCNYYLEKKIALNLIKYEN